MLDDAAKRENERGEVRVSFKRVRAAACIRVRACVGYICMCVGSRKRAHCAVYCPRVRAASRRSRTDAAEPRALLLWLSSERITLRTARGDAGGGPLFEVGATSVREAYLPTRQKAHVHTFMSYPTE